MLTPAQRLARRVRVESYWAQAKTDKEMALAEGVAVSTANSWRRSYGLPPADKRRRHFLDKHGPDALAQLEMLCRAEEPLRKIGAWFGVSGEYARQLRKMFCPDLAMPPAGRRRK